MTTATSEKRRKTRETRRKNTETWRDTEETGFTRREKRSTRGEAGERQEELGTSSLVANEDINQLAKSSSFRALSYTLLSKYLPLSIVNAY